MSQENASTADIGTGTLIRRGFVLEYLTLGWNVIGAFVLLAAALQAGSIALGGFGLDSAIEIVASLVVVWQLTGAPGERDRRAMRVIGFAFAALAIYVAVQSGRTLAAGSHAETSTLGTAWVAATVAAMLALASGKRRTGSELGNAVLVAEARVTLVDAYLATCVLVGLLLSAALGWWWADPTAALVIVVYAVRESRQALEAAGLRE
jgi:divalent metal cation (Fe/Co/Zn/Cd) transporter